MAQRLATPMGLALALAAVVCGHAQAATDEIVVAAVATRPGPLQPDGGDVTTAVQTAIGELNRRGGILGRPLRLIAYEEDCSQASAEVIAGQIVARGASLVVGHLCSAAAIAAAPVYARHGIMMISPGARSPRFTEPRAGPGIFRLAGRDDRFGAETAALIAARFAARRVAIVHDKSVQARTMADAVDRALRSRSITPVAREAYIAGEHEYNAVIDKLAAAEADVIVIPAQPVEAQIIIEGLRARNIAATLIGSEILAVPEMEVAGQRLGDALIVMLPSTRTGAPHETTFNGLAPPADKAVTVTAITMKAQSLVSLQARSALEAWTKAVERTKSLDIAAIARVLETESVPTAAGPIRFDIKGDAVIPSYAPHAWRGTGQDGGWRRLGPQ